MILRTLNFQKADDVPQHGPGDLSFIDQQIGRRLFWLCFVGALAVRQIGSSDSDVILPHAHSDALPQLPVEVDDQYITATQILPQPQGDISNIVGFNLNIKIYQAFHALTAIEMAVGSDVLFDWDRQRTAIRTSLRNVKDLTKGAPPELKLEKSPDFPEWPPRFQN